MTTPEPSARDSRENSRNQNTSSSTSSKNDRVRYEPEDHLKGPNYLLQILGEYVRDNDVEKEFDSMCHKLLSADNLPKNPYPFLTREMRKAAEKHRLKKYHEDEIFHICNRYYEKTVCKKIFKGIGSQDVPIYGLRVLMSIVNPDSMVQYIKILKELQPPYYSLTQARGYSNQAIVCLTGATIFEGSFIKSSKIIETRMEYIVTGEELDENDFVKMIIAATKEKRVITIELCFRLANERFRHGEVQYFLTYVNSNDDSGDNRLFTFGQIPLSTIHTSIFHDVTSAGAYFNILIDDHMAINDTSIDPYAWQYTDPIKSYFQSIVANDNPVRGEENEETLKMTKITIEIFKCFQSLAVSFGHLMHKNIIIRQLINFYGDIYYNSPAINGMVDEYATELKNLLSEEGWIKRCSNEISCAKRWLSIINNLYETSENGELRIPITADTAEIFKEINVQCLPLQLLFIDDVMGCLDELFGLQSSIKNAFNKNDQSGLSLPVSPVHKDLLLSNLIKDCSTTMDVNSAMEKDGINSDIAKETVLIRYIIDSHLDIVWTETQTDFILSERVLPKNPFVIFLDHFNQANYKAIHFGMSEEDILEIIDENKSLIEPTDDYELIYKTNNRYFGLKPALQYLSNTELNDISGVINEFYDTNSRKKDGLYTVHKCQTFGSHQIIHSAINGHLSDFNLRDYILITGPDRCIIEGCELYANEVVDDLHRLVNLNSKPIVIGLYLDGEHWSITSISGKLYALQTELRRVVSEKRQVFTVFYIYISWRYVRVTKYYDLYYLSNNENSLKFQNSSSLTIYESIFFDYDEAVRCVSELIRQTPYSVPMAKEVTNRLDSLASEFKYLQTMSQNLNELISHVLNTQSDEDDVSLNKMEELKLRSFLRGFLVKMNILLVIGVRPLLPSLELFIKKKLQDFIDHNEVEDQYFIQILPTVSFAGFRLCQMDFTDDTPALRS
ncbi:DgyrCDS9593 [Dimorphilus gyrociliatus]|uniref:DgyrCDS9593 n=1 Tax=Dimorphilus gyrociliatus TaxID=2664684 RepID=A0A7I8VXG3_9ANNE|nr:DgyrCDS9593 [Dimorphilus gyrociliatus]